jgi:hypothetical protein
MFSYPPRPWIPSRDNLVSILLGSAAVPSAASTSSGMETAITTKYVAMRLDHLIELRHRIGGSHRNRIVIEPGRRLKPWGGLGGLACTLESITMKSDGGLSKDVASMCTTDIGTNDEGDDIISRALYDANDLLNSGGDVVNHGAVGDTLGTPAGVIGIEGGGCV